MTEGIIQYKEFSDYLNLIQNAISRMSSTSAILKGFAATVVTGISVISFTEVNDIVLFLSILPVFSFCILDVYYLRIERKYRFLYNGVRCGDIECDYSMDIFIPKMRRKEAKIRMIDLLTSPSIWIFYLPAIVVVVLVIIFRIGGII